MRKETHLKPGYQGFWLGSKKWVLVPDMFLKGLPARRVSSSWAGGNKRSSHVDDGRRLTEKTTQPSTHVFSPLKSFFLGCVPQKAIHYSTFQKKKKQPGSSHEGTHSETLKCSKTRLLVPSEGSSNPGSHFRTKNARIGGLENKTSLNCLFNFRLHFMVEKTINWIVDKFHFRWFNHKTFHHFHQFT